MKILILCQTTQPTMFLPRDRAATLDYASMAAVVKGLKSAIEVMMNE
ncbi:MAG: hypothetical protein JNN05_09925 [Candidatus Omnitrophica bacterium]|nr:hypothetical protein [Candidatus Omnitrophota bacterium]